MINVFGFLGFLFLLSFLFGSSSGSSGTAGGGGDNNGYACDDDFGSFWKCSDSDGDGFCDDD